MQEKWSKKNKKEKFNLSNFKQMRIEQKLNSIRIKRKKKIWKDAMYWP